MNTEYAVGNLRIRFESRARRRWFVVLFYTVLAAIGPAGYSARENNAIGMWIVIGCVVLFTAFVIVFSWIAGDMRTRGDEREMHRRDHAHFLAYRILLYSAAAVLSYFGIAALFAGFFRGSDPLAPLLPLTLRELLAQLPHFLLPAVCVFFGSLPQAILLWTEPDMEDPQQAG